MDTCKVAIDEMQKHRPSILIRKYLLVVVEQNDPPMKPSAVYFPSSGDFDMCGSSKRYKILVKFLHFW